MSDLTSAYTKPIPDVDTPDEDEREQPVTERSAKADCRCGATWGGHRTAHCAACHLTFSSESGFNRHLVSQKHAGCHDPATLTRKDSDELVFEWNERRQMWRLAAKPGASPWGGPASEGDDEDGGEE